LAERQATITSLDAQAQTDLVAAIDARGLFAVRGAANYVADLLNCSRATLYKRLAIARAKGENPA
ncbi:MAG: helix-turn-helix domain-containing protein, partial [Rhodobacter sp.]|nr:helix-turn-helix domain-containing protein [Rhodobacter sp.]